MWELVEMKAAARPKALLWAGWRPMFQRSKPEIKNIRAYEEALDQQGQV